MKKTAFIMACGILLAGTILVAQDANTADLQKTAAAPEVQKQFDQPDGAAIFLKPDGSFQILSRGTGTYDFDDVDDINDARKEATLKAKAALAKFMKEKLSTEEGFAEQSKKVKSITSDVDPQTASVLKEQKIPRKGSSGEIQITVGVSSKTLKAVGKLVNAIDATPEQGQQRGAVGTGSAANDSTNKAETRVSDSDF